LGIVKGTFSLFLKDVTKGASVKIGAAILAGGRSIRMGGRNKALLEVGGEPILAKTLAALTPWFDDIIIVGGSPELYDSFGRECHGDVFPGLGSLGGIHAALSHSRTVKTFCIACDMPFVRSRIVSLLIDRAGGDWEAVVPRLSIGLEPLCAVYDRALQEPIEKQLQAGERRIRSVFEGEGRKTLYIDEAELLVHDPELASFVNINTPDDLEKARGIGAGATP
jgi:molybdopterin-guanine dinucleotide biosynthesis protein A